MSLKTTNRLSTVSCNFQPTVSTVSSKCQLSLWILILNDSWHSHRLFQILNSPLQLPTNSLNTFLGLTTDSLNSLFQLLIDSLNCLFQLTTDSLSQLSLPTANPFPQLALRSANLLYQLSNFKLPNDQLSLAILIKLNTHSTVSSKCQPNLSTVSSNCKPTKLPLINGLFQLSKDILNSLSTAKQHDHWGKKLFNTYKNKTSCI